jgi:glutaredoxin-like protein NrdH
MSVTVYTTPNCVQCNATKKHLERIGIEYETVDLSENPDTLREFVEKGLTTAPIVVAGENIWSGYQHAKIESLKA